MKLAAGTLAFLLCFAVLPVLAQTADGPLMGSQATVETGDETAEPTQVLVLGDAIGGGLGAGQVRMAAGSVRFEVSIRFNEESGLVRPDVYDWAASLPKILATNRYDVAVVLLGTNDRQMIRTANERLAFNSPAWIDAYKARMDGILDRFADAGVKVYWVAIPPVADARYDADLKVIAALQRERIEARGFAYLDFRAQFSNPDGSFADIGPDETGTVRKLRGKDGISFFKAGNNKFAQLVLSSIQSGKRDRATARVTVAAPQSQMHEAERSVPLFGQSLTLGGILTFEPKDIHADALVVAGVGIKPSAAFQAIRNVTVDGSDAAKLLRRGEIAPVPKGRADDFSLPPEIKAQ